MALYEFEIGATEVGMVNVEELTVPLPAPKWEFRPWVQTIDLGDGSARGQGGPVGVWKWGFLTRAQREQLRTFCTGKSAWVYINTISDGGTYETYYASMRWPDREQFDAGRVLDFEVEFHQMESVA